MKIVKRKENWIGPILEKAFCTIRSAEKTRTQKNSDDYAETKYRKIYGHKSLKNKK